MANSISVSSAPIARLAGKEYYDLIGTIQVMKTVYERSSVNGFELQLEPEWDSENPPLTDSELADWTRTPKYTTEQISALLRKSGLPILSVHASRDIGRYLCSDQDQHVEKGKRLIRDSLILAQELGATVSVFHLWDTWSTEFNIDELKRLLSDVAKKHPRVKAAVENIPTQLEGRTPFSLVKTFDYITLDLRWAALYDELENFKSLINKIPNIHLRGNLEGNKWVLTRAPFGFYDALNTIKSKWGSKALLTVEPEGGINPSTFANFIKAMKTLQD
jgi:hypothetical protein